MVETLNAGPGIDTMKKFGEEALADVDQRFNTGGYGTWAPLSPVTISKKGHDTILVDTGNMKNSVGIGTNF